jgi:hypothetical protein
MRRLHSDSPVMWFGATFALVIASAITFVYG